MQSVFNTADTTIGPMTLTVAPENSEEQMQNSEHYDLFHVFNDKSPILLICHVY